MDMYDIAIQMEIEGERLYRELIAKTQSAGLKAIFTMLAEDEVKHQKTFLSLKKGKVVPMASSQVSEAAEEVFGSLSEEDLALEKNQLEVYEKALEVELNSIKYYTKQLEKVEDEKIVAALREIIEEEHRHFDLIDDIVLMLERPFRWVEDAEFGVREPY